MVKDSLNFFTLLKKSGSYAWVMLTLICLQCNCWIWLKRMTHHSRVFSSLYLLFHSPLQQKTLYLWSSKLIEFLVISDLYINMEKLGQSTASSSSHIKSSTCIPFYIQFFCEECYLSNQMFFYVELFRGWTLLPIVKTCQIYKKRLNYSFKILRKPFFIKTTFLNLSMKFKWRAKLFFFRDKLEEVQQIPLNLI